MRTESHVQESSDTFAAHGERWSAHPRRPASAPTREMIAERARAIWESKGCPAGSDEENWREAETQLNAETAVSSFSGKDWVGFHEEQDGRLLMIHASGKLSRDDYNRIVPEMERLIKRHGQISILFEMHDFHGWEAGAAWEDTKFALRHFRDIKRVAVVGERQWQEAITTFCKPFTKAEVRYFDHSQAEEAHQWAQGKAPAK